MADQRALHLHGAEAMSGDVDHVVDAAHDPEVAVLVAPGAVAREVDARHLAPVLLRVALGIAVHGAKHAGPRPRNDEIAALVGWQRRAVTAADLRYDAGQGQRRRAGLRRNGAGQGRDHDAARLGLPPGVDDRAALLADDAVVPHPGLWIDRLADGAQQSERREAVPARPLLAPLDERADCRRRGVEDGDAEVVDDPPE